MIFRRTWTPVVIGTLLLAGIAGAAVAQDGEPGSIISATFVERLSAADIDTYAEPLFEEFAHPDALYAVEAWDVRFVTSDWDGSPVVALASVYIPVTRGSREAPVLAFGSGTTGLPDRCAPSLEQPLVDRLGWYRANMFAYAGQGIITIFPDYIGFNDPTIAQRYFSAAAEGHLMLDALRAVRVLFAEYGSEIESRIMPGEGNVTAGYSQGGHAALAAADMNRSYASEIRLDGAIGFGSTNDVGVLMQEAGWYPPSIVYTYQQMYGTARIDPAQILQPRWARTLEADVTSMCVTEFQAYYPFDGRALYTQPFYDALYGGTLARDFPTIHEILEENLTGLSGHGKPVLMIQGNQDIVVTNKAQRDYVNRLRRSGSDVEYIEMEGVRHRQTRPAGFAASIDFIFAVADW